MKSILAFLIVMACCMPVLADQIQIVNGSSMATWTFPSRVPGLKATIMVDVVNSYAVGMQMVDEGILEIVGPIGSPWVMGEDRGYLVYENVAAPDSGHQVVELSVDHGYNVWMNALLQSATGGQTQRSFNIIFDGNTQDLEPVADINGPSQVYIGQSVFLDGSGSWDDHGIDSYHWYIMDPSTLIEYELPVSGAKPTVTSETISALLGEELEPGDQLYIALEVWDTAYQLDGASMLITFVPEPTTMGLLAFGALTLLRRRRAM